MPAAHAVPWRCSALLLYLLVLYAAVNSLAAACMSLTEQWTY